MEFVAGCRIADWVRAEAPSASMLASVVADLADAVHLVHLRGLVHRDINPKNIIIKREEDGRTVPVLLDFGLAKQSTGPGSRLTALTFAGTPGFMAPEQVAGRYERRTDVFGLGATLYALLSESPSSAAVGSSGLPTEVDRALEIILTKALAVDPRDRQDSAPRPRGGLAGVQPPRGAQAVVAPESRQGRLAGHSSPPLAGRIGAGARPVPRGHAPPMGSARGSVPTTAVLPPAAPALAAAPAVSSRDAVSPSPRPDFPGGWRTQAELLAPFASVPEMLSGDDSVEVDGGELGRQGGSSQPYVPLRGVSDPGTEVRAVFGYPAWTRSSRLGLVVGQGNGRQPSYGLVFGAHASGAAMTLAEARARDLFVSARIVRNGVVVREHRWRASALPDGPLELMATRLGDHFAFRVGSLQPGLELIDVIPLVSSNEPAGIGLDWPAGVGLSSLRVRTRHLPGGRRPLEKADELYNANEFGAAADLYREAQATHEAAEAAEAAYKRAACLLRRNHREAVELFATTARLCSAAPPGDPRRRWCLPAAFQAWRIAHAKSIELPGMEELESFLTSGMVADPDDDALVPAITQGELDEFSMNVAPYAYSTSPYHLLKDNPTAIASLEKAVRVLDRLDPSGTASVGPRQELLRAHLSARQYGRAQQVADDLLERAAIDQEWRLTVTRDAVWLAVEQARRPGVDTQVANQTWSHAFDLVENGLRDPVRPDRFRAGCQPLLVEPPASTRCGRSGRRPRPTWMLTSGTPRSPTSNPAGGSPAVASPRPRAPPCSSTRRPTYFAASCTKRWGIGTRHDGPGGRASRRCAGRAASRISKRPCSGPSPT